MWYIGLQWSASCFPSPELDLLAFLLLDTFQSPEFCQKDTCCSLNPSSDVLTPITASILTAFADTVQPAPGTLVANSKHSGSSNEPTPWLGVNSQRRIPEWINEYISWKGFQVALVVKITRLPGQKTRVRSLGWEDPLEEVMATYSSILAWRIPKTEEPGELESMGSQRVRHD